MYAALRAHSAALSAKNSALAHGASESEAQAIFNETLSSELDEGAKVVNAMARGAATGLAKSALLASNPLFATVGGAILGLGWLLKRGK